MVMIVAVAVVVIMIMIMTTKCIMFRIVIMTKDMIMTVVFF
eukprot:CAMPEP_0116877066 /NCGR_PEP_ID=MMETSP0463-20121206/8904_1 /TAXON_ID=181622 /ORGANISM="Strombidinopsis sp, Strain SopsisLIS2011" /LENGTH=40 /DNA_ID= /DNA_START= /DNA_END= /DNA_ORIENTATION=